MRRLLLSLGLLLAVTNVAKAEVQVLDFRSFGRQCREDAVQLLQNGDAFSILFNQLSVNLDAGNASAGRARSEGCHLQVLFKIPNNMCISKLDQTFSGGVIKSKNSSGFLQIS